MKANAMSHYVAYDSKEAFQRAVLYQPKKVLLVDTSTDDPINGRLTDVLKVKGLVVVMNWAETWTAKVQLGKQNRIEVI